MFLGSGAFVIGEQSITRAPVAVFCLLRVRYTIT